MTLPARVRALIELRESLTISKEQLESLVLLAISVSAEGEQAATCSGEFFRRMAVRCRQTNRPRCLSLPTNRCKTACAWTD